MIVKNVKVVRSAHVRGGVSHVSQSEQRGLVPPQKRILEVVPATALTAQHGSVTATNSIYG